MAAIMRVRQEVKKCHYKFVIFAAAIFGLLVLAACSSGYAQEEAAIQPPEPIPNLSSVGRPYKTWSLFVISNPDWLLPENCEKLAELYSRYQAFGAAIGPEHVAVWFWKVSPDPTDLSFTGAYVRHYLDVDRSSAFCQRLKLKPSGGPYIILTDKFPGEANLRQYPETFPDRLDNCYVVNLNSSNAGESIIVLNKIADELVTGDFKNLDPASEGYWQGWQKSFETIRNHLIGFSNKVEVTFKTSFFSTVLSL